MKNNYKRIYEFALFLIILFLVCYSSKILSKYDIFICDDNYYENTFGKYNFYHGTYIQTIITWLFVIKIPGLLHLHPYTFVLNYGCIIKGLIIFFICSCMSLIFFIGQKIRAIPFLLISFFTYIFYRIIYLEYGILPDEIYTALFCIQFNIALFCILFKNISEYLFSDESLITKNNNIFMYFCAFFIGMSSEFIFATTFLALIFLIIYRIFNKNTCKYFIKLLSCLSLGIFAYFLSPTVNGRAAALIGNSLSSDFDTYNKLKIFIKQFAAAWTNNYTLYFIIYFLLTIVLIFVLKKNTKLLKQVNNCIAVTVSIIFGLFIFNLLLFFGGYSYDNSPYFNVLHPDFILLFKQVIMFILIYQAGMILRYKKSVFGVLMIIIACIIYFYHLYPCPKEKINNIIKQRVELNNYKYRQICDIYLLNRIELFYAYQNKQIITTYTDALPSQKSFLESVFNLKNTKRTNNAANINDAYRIYKENGGPEILEEEINNYNFQDLFDKNFVINGQK